MRKLGAVTLDNCIYGYNLRVRDGRRGTDKSRSKVKVNEDLPTRQAGDHAGDESHESAHQRKRKAHSN